MNGVNESENMNKALRKITDNTVEVVKYILLKTRDECYAQEILT